MIRNLQIRNYRRHRKFDIEFDRITVLRGASGKGKTSVMGALRLVAFNQPFGTSFMSWDSELTAVRIVAEKNKITRKRSATTNTYTINGKALKAFGTGVPKSVVDALKLTPLNFHRQHDSPFWFGDTAGSVSRQLNKIVNLDVIDRTTSNLEKLKRETSTRVKDINERIKNAKKDKQELSFVPVMDRKLRRIEAAKQSVEEVASKSRRIDDLIKTTKKYHQNAKRSHRTVTEAVKVLSSTKEWEEVRVKRDRLCRLLRRIGKVQEVAAQPVPNINPLTDLEQKWNEVVEKRIRISTLVANANRSIEETEEWKRKEKELERRFKKQMGKVCPLCERSIR